MEGSLIEHRAVLREHKPPTCSDLRECVLSDSSHVTVIHN